MTTTNDLSTMIGKNAVDSDGSKVGKVGQIYLNDESGQPEWVTVHTGMFGTKESFAPLYGSSTDDHELKLAVSKDLVKDAPSVDVDGHLEQDDASALYAHYDGYIDPANGHSVGTDRPDAGFAGDTRENLAGRSDIEGHDTSGPTTDDAMTRSEERLHVGTETVQTGKARLRKYIVEENVTQTVPVRHEEVRIEREPITDSNRDAAMSGGDLSEEEHEITLHAERPLVSKETVPVERVKLSTETVNSEHQVEETVRKEQIDQVDQVDGDSTPQR